MFIKTFSLVLFVIQIEVDNVVSDTDEHKEDNGESKMRFDDSERRFFQSFKDEDWHIVHLKESDFMEKEGCEETFEDKVKRYKESLKNDGSRVKFVSADAIPRDDSVPTRTCKSEKKDKLASKVTKKDDFKETNIDEKNTNVTKEGENDTIITKANESKNGANVKNKETTKVDKNDSKETNIDENNNTNVTKEGNNDSITKANESKNGANGKNKETSTKVDKSAKKKNPRRKDTDYIFSEAEYDEYGDVWDLGECAADVEQIDLELEDIHEYDVECQFMLDWRSMD